MTERERLVKMYCISLCVHGCLGMEKGVAGVKVAERETVCGGGRK